MVLALSAAIIGNLISFSNFDGLSAIYEHSPSEV